MQFHNKTNKIEIKLTVDGNDLMFSKITVKPPRATMTWYNTMESTIRSRQKKKGPLTASKMILKIGTLKKREQMFLAAAKDFLRSRKTQS